jgi:probable rRNA maturation factor
MDLLPTIDVTSTCVGWGRAYPAAEELARETAGLALAHGMAASASAWPERVELGVTLTDAAEQQRLNRRFRGLDAPTNVLAFSAWQTETPVPSDAPLLLGDVVLAFETVAREADEQGKPFVDHLRHLVVHGVLHLLGFDHLTAAEAVAMESLETSILAEMAVPNPYRDSVGSFSAGPVDDE